MAKFVNLTPHPITIKTNTKTIEIPPSGTIARVPMSESQDGAIDDIPTITRTPQAIVNLPPPKPQTFYLVSSMILQHTTRKDVLAPDTGPTAIRNDNGQIIAVTRLVRNTT